MFIGVGSVCLKFHIDFSKINAVRDVLRWRVLRSLRALVPQEVSNVFPGPGGPTSARYKHKITSP